MRDGAGQDGYAFNALQLCAQLVVIDHVAQPGDARFQCLFAILVEKEARIGQTRTHHALIAIDNVLGIVHLHVGNNQKFIEQLAVVIQ